MNALNSRSADKEPLPRPPMPEDRSRALLALALLLPAPTIGVIVAMMLPATQGTPFGKLVYSITKVWILALPLAWSLWVDRLPLQISKPWRAKGLSRGVLLGVLIAAAILATYFIVGNRMIDVDQMRRMAARNGIGSPEKYLLFVTVLTLVNSLLEEYVWRWFVFRQCERLTGGTVAVILSAAFFTVHHFFALISQAPLSVTLLACLGVFIGGCAWSWCCLRYRSIWPGWISHVIADAAVFSVGYMVLFGSATSH